MIGPWVILSDFDGTITMDDASQLVLSEYAEKGWERYDEMLARGEMGFEDCISRQFGMIRAGESEIMENYDRFVSPRKNFDRLVRFAREMGMPITIVSGGLEFLIRGFLNRNGLEDVVALHVGRLSYGNEGMTVSFPPLREKGAVSFKDDLVLQERHRGRRVIYMGDGRSDLRAALDSDLAFAVRGSKLATLGREAERNFVEFEDFEEVVATLRKFLG